MHVYHERKRHLSQHPYSPICAHFYHRSPSRLIIGLINLDTRKSPRRSMISGKYPRRKYGRSISRSSRHAMRDRLESEHVFFPDQLRFFNLALLLSSFSYSFFFLFFPRAHQCLSMFLSDLASGHTHYGLLFRFHL